MTETKIAIMDGVREHIEREPVELWLNSGGRTVVRAYNEGGNNFTEVDLVDIIEWLNRSRHNRFRWGLEDANCGKSFGAARQ